MNSISLYKSDSYLPSPQDALSMAYLNPDNAWKLAKQLKEVELGQLINFLNYTCNDVQAAGLIVAIARHDFGEGNFTINEENAFILQLLDVFFPSNQEKVLRVISCIKLMVQAGSALHIFFLTVEKSLLRTQITH